ncbi:ferredoxin--NADP reductase [Planctomycetales bacterium ZRK34]|nr:ferredoxin--NADP reductase [Planctomycetales bacterium ZRK34]
MSTPEPYNATIVDWRDVNPAAAVFRVKLDSGAPPTFEPGQYATLGLPRDHPPVENPDEFAAGDPRWKKLCRREYSIASKPGGDTLEFYTVHVRDGKLTSKLWHDKSGGRVWVDPHIKGEFTLQRIPTGQNLVMIATGTGISPYLSMLRTYGGTGRWERFVIVHGVRTADDLGYDRQLRDIAEADSTFKYVPICSREPDAGPWGGLHGRVTDLLHPDRFESMLGVPFDAERCHVYLCGNPRMVDDSEALLQARGFVTHTRQQPGSIHFERYW